MPSLDRFVELCRLRFVPPVRGTRLAELGRLPFHSTVQEFSDRFQAVLCHARDISTKQKAELYVGGLPEHIRVDVEMRDPPDLQTAMYFGPGIRASRGGHASSASPAGRPTSSAA